MRQFQAAHRARNARRAITDDAVSRCFAVRPDVHVARRFLRRALAEIDECRAPIGETHQHETAAAEIARRWMRHRQRKAHRHRRVDRVAARFAAPRRRYRSHAAPASPPWRAARAPAARAHNPAPRAATSATSNAIFRISFDSTSAPANAAALSPSRESAMHMGLTDQEPRVSAQPACATSRDASNQTAPPRPPPTRSATKSSPPSESAPAHRNARAPAGEDPCLRRRTPPPRARHNRPGRNPDRPRSSTP